MKLFLVALAATAVALAGSTTTASADPLPPCGVVVDNTTLRTDCEGPLVIAASRVNVNLAGHTITCNGDASRDGIEIADETDVHVENGSIGQCGTGIEITSGGQHRLNQLEISGSVQNSSAGGGNIGDAIRVTASAGNDIRNVETSHNHRVGVRFVGSTGNSVLRLTATDQDGAVGMQFGSDGNTVESSVALNVRSAAFSTFFSSGNIFRANRAEQTRDGFLLAFGSSNNLVQANRASGSQWGIRVGAGALNNTIQANVSLGNVLDMSDGNPNCDGNVWKANTFNTADQPQCID